MSKINNAYKAFRARYPDFYHFKLVDLVALGGIIFAIIQFYDAKKLSEESKKLSEDTKILGESANDILNQIQNVSSHIQTKPLDEFPKNLPSITKHIAACEKELDIIVDYPIYGILSAPIESEKYITAITQKANEPSCKVHLIVYDTKTRKQEFFRQFSLNEKDALGKSYFKKKFSDHIKVADHATKKDSCKACKLDNFMVNHQIPPTKRPTTIMSLFTLLNEYHVQFLQRLRHPNVTIDSLSTPYSYNFWLVDKKKLIFSLTSLGKRSKEYTYDTKDATLIDFVTTILSNAETKKH